MNTTEYRKFTIHLLYFIARTLLRLLQVNPKISMETNIDLLDQLEKMKKHFFEHYA